MHGLSKQSPKKIVQADNRLEKEKKKIMLAQYDCVKPMLQIQDG
jgi:hypothetical protein